MYCVLHSALTLNLEKSGDIPESIGTARACITYSNHFAQPFEISPSVARSPNNSVAALGKYQWSTLIVL